MDKITTYGEARDLDPGPRLHAPNGDHWIRAGWHHHARLVPVHQLRGDTIDLSMSPPDRPLPGGPFTPHADNPTRPLDPTHYRLQAAADYQRAEAARQRADLAAALLPIGKRAKALRPAHDAATRAYQASQDASLYEAAWHAFRTLAKLDAFETTDTNTRRAIQAGDRATDAAEATASAATEAEHAADQIETLTRTEVS